MCLPCAIGGFFSESAIRFSNQPELWIQNSHQKQYYVIDGYFKFQAQDSFFEYFFQDLEIWKTNRTFWKKATFKQNVLELATLR